MRTIIYAGWKTEPEQSKLHVSRKQALSRFLSNLRPFVPFRSGSDQRKRIFTVKNVFWVFQTSCKVEAQFRLLENVIPLSGTRVRCWKTIIYADDHLCGLKTKKKNTVFDHLCGRSYYWEITVYGKVFKKYFMSVHHRGMVDPAPALWLDRAKTRFVGTLGRSLSASDWWSWLSWRCLGWSGVEESRFGLR